MEIRIKKLVGEAVIPEYAHSTDAGMDLVATSSSEDEFGNSVYGTGLAMAIPEGHVGLLFPRSSVSKTALSLANSVGVIDSGYRGEIMLKFRNTHNGDRYNVGDKVGQIIVLPFPKITFSEVDSLEDTDRGTGGFGSTGK